MASSSSSPIMHPIKYDVFLSFRGETRDNFTSHLHAALRRKQIQTFIDDEEVRKGDAISPTLLKAIEESKLSIIIFSKDYASSTWCLDELMKVLECKKTYGQIVIPVFYHISPSDIRKQTGSFNDAFVNHEKRFKEMPEKVQNWRVTLFEASNLSGWDTTVIKPESVLIEAIIRDILKKLNDLSPSDNKDLVGVELSMQKIESLLRIGSNDVCIVGIWGIGGIGKTTIARAIFNKIFNQFESSYFVENVREESEKNSGLTNLRVKLLSSILEDENCNIGLYFTKERLGRKKFLIVFDDVTSFQQIQDLIGDLKDLGLGSRIIITTRNMQVLRSYGLDEANICEVKTLTIDDALQLFSRYAFGQAYPAEGYMELSNRIVRYAQGVPLALKSLGSHLRGKRKGEWKSEMMKLDKCPRKDIQKVLRISYDGLEDDEKKIFLDIAFFLKGRSFDIVKDILDANGFDGEVELNNLIDKSLISTSYTGRDNIVTMHDLFQEMGREIVRKDCDGCGKRSRLWHHEDIYEVLSKNVGLEAIEGISLDVSKISGMRLNPHAFTRMVKLQFFHVYNSQHHYNDQIKLHGFEDLEYFLFKLIYFNWEAYPCRSFPLKFSTENLVCFYMKDSKVKRLWNGVQNLVNLKHIDLSGSRDLIEIPNLSKAVNLQELILRFCTSLLEITSSSIQNLKKLVRLDLWFCISLRSLPAAIQSKSIILYDCSNLKIAPKISCKVEELKLDYTAIEEVPFIEDQSNLVILSLWKCSRLESLPSSICKCKSLQNLLLNECTKLEKLPDDLGDLEALLGLDLSKCSRLESLPSSICKCKSLQNLLLNECTKLEKLPDDLGDLEALLLLYLSKCSRLESLPSSICKCKSLQNLVLNECTKLEKLPNDLGDLEALLLLDLSKCSRLESLPSSICKCKSLLNLFLNECIKLEKLPDDLGDLEALLLLDLSKCSRLESLPSSICKCKSLQKLILNECTKLEKLPDDLGDLEALLLLDLSKCSRLESLLSSICKCKSLKNLLLDECTKLEKLSDDFGDLEALLGLDLSKCSRLESLPNNICKCKSLQKLVLNECTKLEKLRDDFGDLKDLRGLKISCTMFREVLPSQLGKLTSLSVSRGRDKEQLIWTTNSLSSMRSLEYLTLANCQITKLPDGLGQLTLLRSLNLCGNNFESIPAINNLSYLHSFCISYCERLRSIPKLPNRVSAVAAYNCSSLESLSDLSFLFSPMWFELLLEINFVNFANCFKLNLSKVLHKEPRRLCKRICYSGNEIPEWFHFRKAGSSITFKQPPNFRNKIIVDFSVCAVVAFPERYNVEEEFGVRCRFRVKSGDAPSETFEYRSIGRFAYEISGIGLNYVGKDHVFLWSGILRFESQEAKMFIKFYASDLEVKRCGIHFWFAGEKENEPTSNSKWFVSDEDEEKEDDEEEQQKSRAEQQEINQSDGCEDGDSSNKREESESDDEAEQSTEGQQSCPTEFNDTAKKEDRMRMSLSTVRAKYSTERASPSCNPSSSSLTTAQKSNLIPRADNQPKKCATLVQTKGTIASVRSKAKLESSRTVQDSVKQSSRTTVPKAQSAKVMPSSTSVRTQQLKQSKTSKGLAGKSSKSLPFHAQSAKVMSSSPSKSAQKVKPSTTSQGFVDKSSTSSAQSSKSISKVKTITGGIKKAALVKRPTNLSALEKSNQSIGVELGQKSSVTSVKGEKEKEGKGKEKKSAGVGRDLKGAAAARIRQDRKPVLSIVPKSPKALNSKLEE